MKLMMDKMLAPLNQVLLMDHQQLQKTMDLDQSLPHLPLKMVKKMKVLIPKHLLSAMAMAMDATGIAMAMEMARKTEMVKMETVRRMVSQKSMELQQCQTAMAATGMGMVTG
jgi:hypothetical protein